MHCDFDRIDALVAGELPEDERASMFAHMETCPVCRAYYEAMAGLEGEENAPAGFTDRVMDAVRATPQVKVRRRRPVWQSVAAMAACAALVVGLGFGSGLMGAESAPADGAMEISRTGDDGSDQARDLPLTVHTLTDETLCAQVRTWLAQQNIPELYADGPREAYDLTAEQVKMLNRDIPLLALPEEFLQLELKSAE